MTVVRYVRRSVHNSVGALGIPSISKTGGGRGGTERWRLGSGHRTEFMKFKCDIDDESIICVKRLLDSSTYG